MSLIVRKRPDGKSICYLPGTRPRHPRGLDISQPRIPRVVANAVRRLGIENPHLFGGAVRDPKPRDFDFIGCWPEGSPTNSKDAVPLGNPTQTTRTRVNGYTIDVSPFPQGMTPKEDLADRRRSSIPLDVMAIDLASGRLVDPCNGLADFRAGVVRVEDSNELESSPHLPFRVFRLAVNYDGFGVEGDTLEIIRGSLKRYAKEISNLKEPWRVVRMVAQGLGSRSPRQSLEWWRASGVMQLVMPELYYLSKDNKRAYFEALSACERAPLEGRLPALLRHLEREEIIRMLSRMRSHLNGKPHRIEGTDLRVIAALLK